MILNTRAPLRATATFVILTTGALSSCHGNSVILTTKASVILPRQLLSS
jgi:hypothetical protein